MSVQQIIFKPREYEAVIERIATQALLEIRVMAVHARRQIGQTFRRDRGAFAIKRGGDRG